MSITLEASLREDKGKGSSRRLRHALRTPAIVYGADKNPISISLDFYQLDHLLSFNETIFTSLINLEIGKKKEVVIIKDLQRHPANSLVMHIDFLRIDDKHKLTTIVPLEFIKIQDNAILRLGGILNKFIDSVEVSCLAKDLPSSIEVDVSKLTLENHISLTNLILPEGVNIKALMHDNVDAYDQTVVSISASRKVAEEEK